MTLAVAMVLAAQTAVTPVVIPVVARDAQGKVVRDLTAAELTVTEDGSPESVTAMTLQDLDASGPATALPNLDSGLTQRHIVLYFDLSTMNPKEEEAAIESAQYYLQHEMRKVDVAGVAMLGESLQMVQDFTADRTRLLGALQQLGPALGGMSSDTGGGGGDGEAQLSAVDRDLMALQSLCDSLGSLPYPKTLMLYSGGLARSSTQNEITLRSAINSAVKGDVAIDSIDARLLPVRGAGGSAGAASRSGQGAYNGQMQMGQLTAQQRQQDTLGSLSGDSGGIALLNSTDDASLYAAAEDAEQVRYLVVFSPIQAKRDGKFHKVKMTTSRAGVKLTYAPGYWAPKK